MSNFSAAEAELDQFIARSGAKGRWLFAEALREGLSGEDERFGSLPFGAFLEPRLFMAVAGWDVLPPAQLLAHAFDETTFAKGIRVRSDDRGRILLPQIGVLSVETAGADYLLSGPQRLSELRLSQHSVPVMFARQPIEVTEAWPIELVPAFDPFVCSLIREALGSVVDLDFDLEPAEHRQEINTALALLAATDESLAQIFRGHLKSVATFRSRKIESFSAISLHGMIFLNLCEKITIPHILEDIAHQAGHVVFAAATFDRSQLFECDPDTELISSAEDRASRTVYDAFHGIYTAYLEARVLSKLSLPSSGCPPHFSLEVSQRAAAGRLRLRRLLEDLPDRRRGLLSGAGRSLRSRIERAGRSLEAPSEPGNDAPATMAGGR